MNKLPENWAILGCNALHKYFIKNKIHNISGKESGIVYRIINGTWDFFEITDQYEIITLQQYLDSLKPEREIIGYRLVKPEYEEAACMIGFDEHNREQYTRLPFTKDLGINFGFDSGFSYNLKQAGVLDIWFEPVYKEEEKVFIIGGIEVKVKGRKAYVCGEDVTDFIIFSGKFRNRDVNIAKEMNNMILSGRKDEYENVINALKD